MAKYPSCPGAAYLPGYLDVVWTPDEAAEIIIAACEVFEKRYAIYAEYMRRIGDPDRTITDADRKAALLDYFTNREAYDETI